MLRKVTTMDNAAALLSAPLFAGIRPEDLSAMLTCLSAREHSFGRGDIIFSPGQTLRDIGLVLRGSVLLYRDDFWGNRSVMGQAAAGQVFGETYACVPGRPLNVTAAAAESATILLLDISRVLHTCTSACPFHSRLVENLLGTLAEKNLAMSAKITHMSQRTTREKLLSYLSEQSLRAGSTDFSLPFNRQELADYLGVERSAMSAELSRMRRDGLIEFEKNRFSLKEGIRDVLTPDC